MTDSSRPALTHTPDPVLATYLDRCAATAYVRSPSNVPDADHQREVGIKHVRDQVTELADAEVADRMAEAITAAGRGAGATLVATAGQDTVHVWDSEAELPERVSGGPLPDLASFLAVRQAWIPHAVVLVDRAGADLHLVSADHEERDVEVEGERMHLRKVQPGGWSQRRFQQRAEEQWEENIGRVVERLVAEIERTGIDFVMCTGDPHAVSILRDRLPERVAADLVDLDAGSRSEDGSTDAVAAAADAAVREEAARRRAAAQTHVLDAVGRGAGVTGRHDVLQALFENRVGTLLVHQADAAGIDAHIGPEPIQVAADSSVLHELGLDATRVSLVDAALRGAAATGAGVVMLTDAVAEITDGVAAALRGTEDLGGLRG